MSHQYRFILKYLGLFGSIQGMNLLVGLIRGKLVSELLGSLGVGLLSLFNTTVSLLSNATGFGLSFSAVKVISESEEGEEQRQAVTTVRVWSLIAAAIGFIVTVIAAPIINHFTFTWGDHTLHYLLLAPTVSLIAITGGETAILKAARKIKHLATVQVITIILSVLIAVPIYYVWSFHGIVPVIFLTALATAVATLWHSLRHFPVNLRPIRQHISQGMPMVRLGLSFIVAGIMGSGVELYIRAFLNTEADLDMVGLYYAAYTMAITYPSALLNSLENDYFSRLSAVNSDNRAVCATANAQIEVLLMVMFPVIALLMVALPIIVPLFFSTRFIGAVPMAQITLLAMLFRTAVLPLEYISLAKGLPKTYLLIETMTSIATVLFLTFGYYENQLAGMGMGLVAVYVLEFAAVLCLAHCAWQFTLSRRAALLFTAEVAFLAILHFLIT